MTTVLAKVCPSGQVRIPLSCLRCKLVLKLAASDVDWHQYGWRNWVHARVDGASRSCAATSHQSAPCSCEPLLKTALLLAGAGAERHRANFRQRSDSTHCQACYIYRVTYISLSLICSYVGLGTTFADLDEASAYFEKACACCSLLLAWISALPQMAFRSLSAKSDGRDSLRTA